MIRPNRSTETPMSPVRFSIVVSSPIRSGIFRGRIDAGAEAPAYHGHQGIRMKLVEREGKDSTRPYRTRKSHWDAVSGFHPGLFSILPSGKKWVLRLRCASLRMTDLWSDVVSQVSNARPGATAFLPSGKKQVLRLLTPATKTCRWGPRLRCASLWMTDIGVGRCPRIASGAIFISSLRVED